MPLCYILCRNLENVTEKKKKEDTLRHNHKPQKWQKQRICGDWLKNKVEKLRFSSFLWFIISDFSSAVRQYGDDKKSKISALNLSFL